MHTRKVLGLVAMVLLITVPRTVDAQQHQMALNGEWNLEFSAPWGQVVWMFEMNQDGEMLTGQSVQGMGTLVLEGTIKGHAIEFVVDLKDGPHALTMICVGIMDERGVSGTLEVDGEGEAEWVLVPAGRGVLAARGRLPR